MSDILGPDGGVVLTAKIDAVKAPIVDFRIVMFGKMMVHPKTKEMVMVPMQDIQYQRQGSNIWYSVPLVENDKHEFNPEVKANES